jgi:Tol biopolymer transport system component
LRKPFLVATVVGVALLVLTSVGSAQTQIASPSPTGPVVGVDEPWIAYQWVDGPDTIFLARADGSDGHVLVTGLPGINQWHPDWSPDGRVLAFTNENYGAKDIWVADVSGENAHLLYDSPPEMPFVDHPAFSPDGTQIVADSYDREPTYDVSTRSALMVIDTSTGEASEISVLEGEHRLYAHPRWSPDGDALVVSIGLYDETDKSWIGEAIAVLHRTDAGWSEPDVITDFSAFGSYPDWSPDGETIVFATKDNGWFVNTMTNHGKSVAWDDITPDLHTVRPDGSDVARITDTAQEGGFAGQPSWTSDGRVIFTRSATDEWAPSTAYINADGSGLDVLANSATHSRLRRTP